MMYMDKIKTIVMDNGVKPELKDKNYSIMDWNEFVEKYLVISPSNGDRNDYYCDFLHLFAKSESGDFVYIPSSSLAIKDEIKDHLMLHEHIL